MSRRSKEEEESGRVGSVNVKETRSHARCNSGGTSSPANGSEYFLRSLQELWGPPRSLTGQSPDIVPFGKQAARKNKDPPPEEPAP